jgi:DAACS family dicarboxylate/amino acid:cation (Na+ or H+) symporter
MTPPKKLAIGIGIGVTLGILTNNVGTRATWLLRCAEYVAEPVGRIFLRLLLMLVLPLAFSALVLAIGEIQPKQLGRIGMRTLRWTFFISAIAVVIGITLVQLIGPGRGLGMVPSSSTDVSVFGVTSKSPSPMELLIGIVPSNPIASAASGDMLGFLVFALIFGIGMAQLRSESVAILRRAIEGIFEVSMRLIELILRLAPLGIGALLFAMTARLGPSLLTQLGKYVFVVVLGLALQLFVVYSATLYWFAKMSPLWFFRRIRLVLTTAFSTASSNATLPTSLRVAESELMLPRDVSRFVLTAGASMNQNGTALFEGVTVLFLAQAYGIELGLGQQALLMVICVLAGFGTAGVPAGSLPVIATILALVGVPKEAVGLIIGVDRLLDMCRTTVNVAGDLVLAAVVSRSPMPNSIDSPAAEAGSAEGQTCEAARTDP